MIIASCSFILLAFAILDTSVLILGARVVFLGNGRITGLCVYHILVYVMDLMPAGRLQRDTGFDRAAG